MAVFTDNFNRANTMAGDLGGNWQVHPTSTNRILDNKVRDKGRSLFSFGQTETPNQVVAGLFRVLSNHPLTEKYGVILRGADDAGYVAGFEINATTVTYVIWKRLNGVLTELARAGSGSPVPVGFDVPLRAVVDGSGVKIINPTTNSPIIQVNDAISPLAGPGYGGVDLGVDGLAVACAFDNFFLEDLRGPTPPYRPICSVTDITVEGATLLGSNFYDQDLDSHAASHYQVVVATASDFSTPLVSTIVQTGETPNDEGLVRRAVTGLASGTRYKARLRYQDSSGMWSEWSPIVFFTTAPEILPVRRKRHDEATYEISCAEAPERVYSYTLVINTDLQSVEVAKIEGPEGLYEWGMTLPYCVIADIADRMIEARAQFGLVISGCEQGRIEIPFEAGTPRPITVEHNCGLRPIVQVVELTAPVGGYYSPYSLQDEVVGGFAGEPPAASVWVNHLDENRFQVHTTVQTGLIIAVFR